MSSDIRQDPCKYYYFINDENEHEALAHYSVVGDYWRNPRNYRTKLFVMDGL